MFRLVDNQSPTGDTYIVHQFSSIVQGVKKLDKNINKLYKKSQKQKGIQRNDTNNNIWYESEPCQASESRDSNPESHEPESCMLPLHHSPPTPTPYNQTQPANAHKSKNAQ